MLATCSVCPDVDQEQNLRANVQERGNAEGRWLFGQC